MFLYTISLCLYYVPDYILQKYNLQHMNTQSNKHIEECSIHYYNKMNVKYCVHDIIHI